MYGTVKELAARITGGSKARSSSRPAPTHGRATIGAHPELVAGITDINWAWDPSPVPEKVRPWYAEGDGILIYARELADSDGCDRDTVVRLDEEVRREADAVSAVRADEPAAWPRKRRSTTRTREGSA